MIKRVFNNFLLGKSFNGSRISLLKDNFNLIKKVNKKFSTEGTQDKNPAKDEIKESKKEEVKPEKKNKTQEEKRSEQKENKNPKQEQTAKKIEEQKTKKETPKSETKTKASNEQENTGDKKPVEKNENKEQATKPKEKETKHTQTDKQVVSKESGESANQPQIPKRTLEENEMFLKRYNELMANLNKDFNQVRKTKQEERLNKTFPSLLPNQKRFIGLLSSKVARMNVFQVKYISSKIGQNFKVLTPIAPLSYSKEWQMIQESVGNQIPSTETKFPQYEELMKQFAKWYQEQLPGFGFGAASLAAAPKEEGKKEEGKEPKNIAKSEYDVELTSYEQGKKIALIKEIKTMTSLGLKESKELVEKTPVVIFKKMKKDEAEALKSKMAEFGAVITLK